MSNKNLTKEEKNKILKAIENVPAYNFVKEYCKEDNKRYRFTGENSYGVYAINENISDENRLRTIEEKLETTPTEFRSLQRKIFGYGDSWYDFKNSTSGYGLFYLIKNEFVPSDGISYKEQLEQTFIFIKNNLLDENYNLNVDLKETSKKTHSNNKTKNVGFVFPDPAPQFTEMGKNYLINQRSIPPSLVEKGFEENKIYTFIHTFKKDDVFVNEECLLFAGAKSGEMRSIKGTAKQTFLGSEKYLSGFTVFPKQGMIKNNQEIVFAITEAAIDSLSYNALFPDRIVTSSNGSVNFHYQYLYAKEAFEMREKNMNTRIHFAFDADYAGDKAAQELYNAFYLRQLFIKKLQPKVKESFEKKNLEEKIAFLEKRTDSNSYKKLLGIVEGKQESDLTIEEKQTIKEISDEAIERNLVIFIDESIIEKEISTNVYNSPHVLFANNPIYQTDYAVYENKKGNILSRNVEDILGVSPPIIEVVLSKDFQNKISKLGLNLNDRFTIPVKEEAFNHFSSYIVRERPLHFKDWNEELKALKDYNENFEKGYKDNFENGFPDVKHLSIYRKSTNIQNYSTEEKEFLLANGFDSFDRLSSSGFILQNSEETKEVVNKLNNEQIENKNDSQYIPANDHPEYDNVNTIDYSTDYEVLNYYADEYNSTTEATNNNLQKQQNNDLKTKITEKIKELTLLLEEKNNSYSEIPELRVESGLGGVEFKNKNALIQETTKQQNAFKNKMLNGFKRR